MAQKIKHFIDEADIGSGEKTAAEQEDLEQTRHLKEQQEQAKKQSHPLDGSQLQQVVEEQQYVSQQENHVTQNANQHTQQSQDQPPGQEQKPGAVPAQPARPPEKETSPSSRPDR